MAKGWYYEKDRRQHGPVSHEELKKLVFTGELGLEVRVSNDGTKWRPAKQVTGLPPSQPTSPNNKSSVGKFAAIGCGGCAGLFLLLIVCSGVLSMIAATVDPGGYAKVSQSKAATSTGLGDVLSEDYFPYLQGETRKFNRKQYVGDQTMFTELEVRFDADKVMRRRHLDSFVVGGGGASINLPVGADQHYRVQGDFVEIGEFNDGSNQIDWSPVVKLGASVGDQWEKQLYGETMTFTLARFEEKELPFQRDGQIYRIAVVRSSLPYPNDVGEFRIETKFAKGFGIYHRQGLEEIGGETEIKWSELVSP